MLAPLPFPMRTLGAFAKLVRPSTLPQIFTYREIITQPVYRAPIVSSLRMLPALATRWISGARAMGAALVGALVKGCVEARCSFRLDCPAEELITDANERVVGVRARANGVLQHFLADHAVIIASGGFEWNTLLFEQHFPGGAERIGSPRSNTGDGQRMAEAVGARLERMDQANIFPCLPTYYEGRPHGLPTKFQASPYAIVVNSSGDRFANEYDWNIGEAIDRRHPLTGSPMNLPCWVVADARFLAASRIFRWYAAKDAAWVRRAPTLEALAREIHVPAAKLVETVARFNLYCENGRDADFARGESVWDRYLSRRGPGNAPNPTLGYIREPPFVAMSLNRSVLGTKGGARTNAAGQVLRVDGSVIDGLYCAGNAMANPLGTRALGSGTTLGPCMTWGFICARSILTAMTAEPARTTG
jgi:3-oxosteroid 1-dehydrogenase